MPDTANQTVVVTVTADPGDAIGAFDLNAVINDGNGGPIFFGPVGGLLGTDFDTNSVWSNNPNNSTTAGAGAPLAESFKQFAQTNRSFDLSGNSLVPNGTLVTLRFDTTGIFSGQYSVKLDDADVTGFNFPGSTFFNLDGLDVTTLQVDPVAVDFVNGSISIVPEPSSLLLGLVGCIALFVVRRRTRN